MCNKTHYLFTVGLPAFGLFFLISSNSLRRSSADTRRNAASAALITSARLAPYLFWNTCAVSRSSSVIVRFIRVTADADAGFCAAELTNWRKSSGLISDQFSLGALPLDSVSCFFVRCVIIHTINDVSISSPIVCNNTHYRTSVSFNSNSISPRALFPRLSSYSCTPIPLL